MRWWNLNKNEILILQRNEMYSIQHYVIDQWFSPCIPVSSTNKTDRHDIAEKLLKVALNTITLTL